MAEPYVPIAEYAAPSALMTALETAVNNNLSKATNVLNDKNAAQAAETTTVTQKGLVFPSFFLGGA